MCFLSCNCGSEKVSSPGPVNSSSLSSADESLITLGSRNKDLERRVSDLASRVSYLERGVLERGVLERGVFSQSPIPPIHLPITVYSNSPAQSSASENSEEEAPSSSPSTVLGAVQALGADAVATVGNQILGKVNEQLRGALNSPGKSPGKSPEQSPEQGGGIFEA